MFYTFSLWGSPILMLPPSCLSVCLTAFSKGSLWPIQGSLPAITWSQEREQWWKIFQLLWACDNILDCLVLSSILISKWKLKGEATSEYKLNCKCWSDEYFTKVCWKIEHNIIHHVRLACLCYHVTVTHLPTGNKQNCINFSLYSSCLLVIYIHV